MSSIWNLLLTQDTRYRLISLQCHPGTDVTVTCTSCIDGLYKDTRYELGLLSFGIRCPGFIFIRVPNNECFTTMYWLSDFES